jgi:hypothetical protein
MGRAAGLISKHNVTKEVLFAKNAIIQFIIGWPINQAINVRTVSTVPPCVVEP